MVITSKGVLNRQTLDGITAEEIYISDSCNINNDNDQESAGPNVHDYDNNSVAYINNHNKHSAIKSSHNESFTNSVIR